MSREIKKMIFFIKEPYKKTLAVECISLGDFAKFLTTLRKRGYTKPALYQMNMGTFKFDRISYRELYDYIKRYMRIDKKFIKKFRDLFM